jgi:hypothetical protein
VKLVVDCDVSCVTPTTTSGSGRNEWKIFFLWRNFSLISEVDVYIVDCPESS